MKNILIVVFSIVVTVCFGQSNDKYEPFTSSDYSAAKYIVKLDTIHFSKFNIEIRQVKTLDGFGWDSTSFYCRGWIIIKQGEKIITQQFLKYIEPVGGCSGLFIPETQPRNDFFIFSKFGDYQGSIFILDTNGILTEKAGGTFYISNDKRYLFSNYDSDAAGLTVFDLNKRQLLYSDIDNIPNNLGAWYFDNGKYFARAYDYDSSDNDQKIKIATFDFTTKKIVITTVDKSFLKEEKQLKVYNDFQYKDCNCGK